MISRTVPTLPALFSVLVLTVNPAASQANAAGEYSKHLDAYKGIRPPSYRI